jgi:iron uptake system component EfeO
MTRLTRPTRRPGRGVVAAIALTAAVPLLVTGCATSDPAAPGSTTGSGAVRIDFTDDGCAPVPATVEAGALTFAVTNNGAGRVTEAEVMQDGRILAEKENLTPGLTGRFSLRLEAGEYVIYCPNAKQDRSTLTVKAAGSSATATTDASLTAAVTAYRGFLQNRADALLPSTRAFAAAVKAGNIAQAKKLFAPARANYEAIEPVAESFGDLDPEIDARVNDVEDPTTWSGFHRIEKALWADKSLAGMDAYADKLVADVSKLVELIPTAELQPANIANGAVELLGEVANSKITGEEDRYSHTDLWDFEANVAGVREAIDVLSPALRQRGPQLLSTANRQFTAVLDALSRYKTVDGYVDYSTVGRADRRQLTTLVNTLAETLSKVAPAIV